LPVLLEVKPELVIFALVKQPLLNLRMKKKAKFRIYFNKQLIGYSADWILVQPNNTVVYLKPLHNNPIDEVAFIKFNDLIQTY
jgi:hypothetical protein